MSVRPATHAGSWFEKDKTLLSKQIQSYVLDAKKKHPEFPIEGARVLVGPHAGYAYCGSILAEAYSAWDPSKVKRVFIMGPSHYLPFRGASLTTYSAFETPFGNVPVDTECVKKFMKTNLFESFPKMADQEEHSIEMHLPFLYKMSEDSPNGVPSIVPIVICSTDSHYEKKLGELLAPYVKDEENAFIISTDFCHWGKRFRFTAYTPNISNLSKFTTETVYDATESDEDSTSEDGRGQFEEEKEIDRTSLEFKGLTNLSLTNYKSSLSKKVPISDSIEYLDRRGMIALSTGDVELWNSYINITGNTICGERPLSVLLHCLTKASKERLPLNGFKSSDEKNSWGKLKWVGYKQSGKVKELRDSSVSYASGFSVI